MALPADFSKIFGSTATGGLTPIGDVNYAKGWEFVGSNPPTKNDFSYLQNFSDLKSQWLYSNKLQRTNPFGDIKADGAAAVSTALENLGLEEIAKAGVGTGFLSGNGYMKIPLIISGLKVEGIIQWGTALVTAKTTAGQVTTQISFPVNFPSSCLQVVATHDDPNGSNALFSVGALGSGSFWASVYKLTANGAGKAVIAIDGSASLRYIGIGY